MNSTQEVTTYDFQTPMDHTGVTINSNEPQAESDVAALPELELGPKGWTGSGEYFRVVENVVNIKNSDADASCVPTPEQRRRTHDGEGNWSEYVSLPHDDSIYQMWMFKIGPFLGDWVLGKGYTASPRWKLMKFPKGYTLWQHKTGTVSDPANPRKDAYLYGGPHIFRSPMEFAEHAIWLMRGRPIVPGAPCLCKYCTTGQSQRDINLRLGRGRIIFDDDDDDVDVDDEEQQQQQPTGNGSDENNVRTAAAAGAVRASSSSSSSSRRVIRGASGQARRARQAARRDRSPPIMAKDYRIGNVNAATPPSPSPCS